MTHAISRPVESATDASAGLLYYAALVASVPFVIAVLCARLLLGLVIAPGHLLIKRLHLAPLFKKAPLTITLFTNLAAILFLAKINALFARGEYGLFAALVPVWLLVVGVFTNAIEVCNPEPKTVAEVDELIQTRWPERWFAKRLREPRDAFFIRLVVLCTIALIPPFVMLLLPGGFSWLGVVLYMAAIMPVAMAHETLDHANIHNRVFRVKQGLGKLDRALVWLCSAHFDLIIGLAIHRAPNFYRIQHCYIHHVENNSLRDTQTTLVYDRLSFFDFCRQALRIALEFTHGFEAYRYLVRKRKFKLVREMALGHAYWWGVFGLVALYNPQTVIAIMVMKVLEGVFVASNIWSWHGLVDMDEPDNLPRNSVNFHTPDPDRLGGFGALAHIEHHIKPGAHWTGLYPVALEKREQRIDDGANVLKVGVLAIGLDYCRVLWMKRFDLLQEYLATRDLDAAGFERLIIARTRPVVPLQRPRVVVAADEATGWFASQILLMPALPTLERLREQEAQAAAAAVPSPAHS